MGYVLALIILVILIAGVRIVQQYEKGVVFRLGRVRMPVKEPGLRLIIPIIDRMRKVDLRTQTMPIQSQNIITRDNVSIDVSAVAYFHVKDSIKSIIAIENMAVAINQIAQTTVRNVIGQSDLDDVLSATENINVSIKKILDAQTEQWGVVITVVELKDI